jgi:hypothetical protein
MTEEFYPPTADTIDPGPEQTNPEQPNEAADGPMQAVKGLIEQHPMAMLAGGILIGALIASALPRGKTRAPAKAANTFGKQATRLAAMGAQLATAYAARAAQAGREGTEKLEDLGEIISDTSGEAKRRTGEMADLASTALREMSTVALRRAAEIAARLKR